MHVFTTISPLQRPKYSSRKIATIEDQNPILAGLRCLNLQPSLPVRPVSARSLNPLIRRKSYSGILQNHFKCNHIAHGYGVMDLSDSTPVRRQENDLFEGGGPILSHAVTECFSSTNNS